MKKLGDISINVPVAKQTKESYDTYIQIGELLTGNVKEDLLQSLEIEFDNAKFFPKLLIAWCLSKIYMDIGVKDKSDKYKDYCAGNAPYCKPLQIFE